MTVKEKGRPRAFDRDQALRQAMEVFWDSTYEGASVAKLTAAMGINPPSLYAAFGDKERLFRSALELYLREVGDAIWAPLEAAPTARDGVAGLLEATAEAYTRPGSPRGCMIVLGASFASDCDPVGEDLRRRRMACRDDLVRRIRRGVEEGDVAEDFDIAQAADFYLTVQTGMALLARDGAGRAALLGAAAGAMHAWPGFAASEAAKRRTQA